MKIINLSHKGQLSTILQILVNLFREIELVKLLKSAKTPKSSPESSRHSVHWYRHKFSNEDSTRK